MSKKKQITVQVKLDPEEKANLDKISEEYGLENARRLTYFILRNISNGTISMLDIVSKVTQAMLCHSEFNSEYSLNQVQANNKDKDNL